MTDVITHPTSAIAKKDRWQDRENLARALRSSQMMREQAREQINATSIITEIQAIDQEMDGERDPAGNRIPVDKEILTALKARADIKFRLLSKVLPDLKATEAINHTTHDHNHSHLHAKISNVELAQRLQLWRSTLPKPPSEAHTAHTTTTTEESAPECTFDIEDIL